ncbi:hypothetical protein JMJ55_25325 [Belnapia sp. T6]|uniref:Uncharacterized protein n=1 Tax=Belnapia mucosa TaxID=2804532 RepID=A0ABS1VBG6_9PROT|nr:hypothetical protein [Belnapia mucosa]MBL6458662.1 hypothetical protein [Belnapia mucosa]
MTRKSDSRREICAKLWRDVVAAYENKIRARHELVARSQGSLSGLLHHGPSSWENESAAEEVREALADTDHGSSGEEPTRQDQELWRSFVSAHRSSRLAQDGFLRECDSAVEILRHAMNATGRCRRAALDTAALLKPHQKMELLEDLLALASYTHGQTHLSRRIVLSLPTEWLKVHLEQAAKPILQDASYEEFGWLLELYKEVDMDLARKLAEEAVNHPEEDVRSVGRDFFTT